MIDKKALLESRILLVDHHAANLALLEASLKGAGHINVTCTDNSAEALKQSISYLPDLIILNLQMPGMDGFELLRLLREKEDCTRAVQILVYAESPTAAMKDRALVMGASEFIASLADEAELKFRVRACLEIRNLDTQLADQSVALLHKVKDRTKALWESQLEIIERLTRLAAFRDDPTGDHCRRVGDLSAELAREIGMDRTHVELIRMTAPLHDLGKLGLTEALVLTRGMYSSDQKLDSQRHAIIGWELLCGGSSPLLKMAALIARHHHENWDGSGYPDGLAGEAIPLVARVVSVADAFDAMTCNCEYRRRMEPTQAVSEIALASGTRYDPTVVMAFLKIVGEGRHLSDAA